MKVIARKEVGVGLGKRLFSRNNNNNRRNNRSISNSTSWSGSRVSTNTI